MTLVHPILWLAILCTTGCAFVGPKSISNGRLAYNEVIAQTDDQELLNMIVRDRYGHSFSMLNVSSVTANVKFRSSVGAEFQAWESSGRVDDLVPLSLGVAYEENPTISYTPVKGEDTLRRMVLPITVEEGYLLTEMATEAKVAARELYRRVNNVENPVGRPPSPEFERLLALATELRDAGVSRFGRVVKEDGSQRYFFSLVDYGEEHADTVRAYLEALGIEGKTVDGRDILVPFQHSIGSRAPGELQVETRSVLDWIRQAGSLIEIPAEHLEAGIVEPSGWGEMPKDRFITIHSSMKRPKNASIAVPFRDWWFYIDDRDTRSKNSFRLIEFLVRLRMNVKGSEQQFPVLTVPVG